MTVPRRYSVADVQGFVDLFREQGAPEGITPEQVAGMQKLVDVLRMLEYMTDDDIERWIRASWNRL